jgi:hypothetical protein
MPFYSDLQFGKSFERKFAEQFARGREVVFASGYFKDWDLKIFNEDTVLAEGSEPLRREPSGESGRREVTYEVKSDRMAYKTGNLPLEFQCNKKPSGISCSKADFSVYYILNENKEIQDLYIIPTEHLRELVKEKKYSRQVRGGDGWRSEMYLFSLNLFSEYLIKNGV